MVSGSTFTVAGRFQLLARWPETLYQILSGIPRAAHTVLGVYLERTCSRDTSAFSALGVLNDNALHKSTYSVTIESMSRKLSFPKCSEIHTFPPPTVPPVTVLSLQQQTSRTSLLCSCCWLTGQTDGRTPDRYIDPAPRTIWSSVNKTYPSMPFMSRFVYSIWRVNSVLEQVTDEK